jgi:hypothetical protein
MPGIRRLTLSDFSRTLLSADTSVFGEKPDSRLEQASIVSQDSFAEHVFAAMAKPTDELNTWSARPARVIGGSVYMRELITE